MTPLLQELGGFEGVLTDVGSVKRPLIEAVSEYCPHMMPQLVPGHPIAGSERHGVTAASPELFLNHKVILTPSDLSNPEAVRRIQKMWAVMGADVIVMAADHHDAVLAQTSHLPHLLAYTLVDVLAGFGDGREVFDYAAGGFRDFSRIAASDPEMWRDIFLSNKTALLRLIDTFQEALAETAALIENDQTEQLMDQLARAKSARDYFASIQPTSKQQ
jgi:3-phosphoshikimate 1-carboxyvinyltransferase